MAATDEDRDDGLRDGVLARLGRISARAGRALADTIVPPVCLACQRHLGSHDALCAACWRQIRFIRAPVCERLGIPMPFDTGGPIISGAALKDPPDWDRARAVAHFDPLMRELIHKFKYADRHDARRLFARWMSEAGMDLLADADLIVPVPLHRWRLMRRKFNQAGLLVQEIARRSGKPHTMSVLLRTKATRTQVGLSEAERRSNLSGAFAVAAHARAQIKGRNVMLIDDVITTGSTVAACARVLRRAGAARVDVLALAMVTDDSRIGR